MRKAIVGAIAAGLIAGGALVVAGAAATSTTHLAPTCHLGVRVGQLIPDHACTPGVRNPVVTQASIGTTICSPGWTATVRPSVSVTNRMKRQAAAAYGIPVSGEYDHLIPLELGGAPVDTRNLWVEPGPIPNDKDRVENALKAAVCAGRVPLTTAQRLIAASWPTALADAGLR